MKHGTTIAVLALINFVTIFSGLPTGWKKGVIIVTTALLIAIGWMLRTAAKRRAERARIQAEAFEAAAAADIQDIAKTIAADVTDRVEEEIHRI